MDEESRRKLAELFQQFDRIAEDVKSAFEPLRKSLAEVESFFSEHQQQIQETLQVVAQTFQKLPEDTRQAQEYLARRGWFISLRYLPLSRIGWIARHAERGNHDEIEEYILDHARVLVQSTSEKVEELYPHRSDILEQAIDAHESGKYAVSIPTMLAQADGMFFEITGKTFFSNEGDKLEDTRRRLLTALHEAGEDTTASTLAHLMVRQLHEESTMHENFDEAGREPMSSSDDGPLNRHYVLHGLTTDYDTEENSLRAVALVDLLCDTKDTLTQNDAREGAV